MRNPEDHRHAVPLPDDVVIHQVEPARAGAVAAEMYAAVGRDWHWRDRSGWSEADWQNELSTPLSSVWLLSRNNQNLGYFQLGPAPEDAIELKYFGLLHSHLGQGLGGPLLSAAIERAWALGPRSVVVNTCSLDHPAALPNYLRRGFEILATQTDVREIES